MKTAVIKTFILLIVLLTAAAFPYRAYAEESVIIRRVQCRYTA